MKMLAASIFIYFSIGLIIFMRNWMIAREHVPEELMRKWQYKLGAALSLVLWLPIEILMRTHKPSRDFMISQAIESVRGPSIEPIMPAMSLPEPCSHPSCKSFTTVDGPDVLWCEACGSLMVPITSQLDNWVKPNSSIYFPMPKVIQ